MPSTLLNPVMDELKRKGTALRRRIRPHMPGGGFELKLADRLTVLRCTPFFAAVTETELVSAMWC